MDRALTIAVPGTLDGLAEALRATETFCVGAGVSGRTRVKVLTVLDEVLANVVHHGLAGAGGTSDTIELAMARQDGRLQIRVADSATPFNPLLLPAPDTSLPLQARRIGGLGIALVRALTDEAAYDWREGRNHLTLTWRAGIEPAADSTLDEHAD